MLWRKIKQGRRKQDYWSGQREECYLLNIELLGEDFLRQHLGRDPKEVSEQAFQGSANAKNLRQEHVSHI